MQKEDVLKLVEVILDKPVRRMQGQGCIYKFCSYCFATKLINETKEFKHEPDCPVLVAERLLEEIQQ